MFCAFVVFVCVLCLLFRYLFPHSLSLCSCLCFVVSCQSIVHVCLLLFAVVCCCLLVCVCVWYVGIFVSFYGCVFVLFLCCCFVLCVHRLLFCVCVCVYVCRLLRGVCFSSSMMFRICVVWC